MANLVASDNPFPSILIEEGTEPTAPAAGHQRLYIDSTSHDLMIVDSTGTETAVGGASGAVATDAIWDAAGDLVQGTGANTAAKLTAGTAGMFLKSAGAAAANLWGYPPGYELDYAQITSAASITASTAATANTVVSGASVTYDGGPVIVTISAPWHQGGTGGNEIVQLLYLDGSNLLEMARGYTNLSLGPEVSVKLTPSAGAHTFSWRCYTNGNSGTRQVNAGTGTGGAYRPAFIRVVKA